jgi:hypothetical protein
MSAVAYKKVIFESDGWPLVTADQWSELHRVPQTTGASALAYALVEEAWSTALRDISPLPPGKHSKHRKRHYRKELHAREAAVRWFYADDTHPFSFRYVCSALGLAHEPIRRELAVALDRRDHAPLVPAGNGSSPDFSLDQWQGHPIARHGT